MSASYAGVCESAEAGPSGRLLELVEGRSSLRFPEHGRLTTSWSGAIYCNRRTLPPPASADRQTSAAPLI